MKRKLGRGGTIWFVSVSQEYGETWGYRIQAKLARVAMARALGRYQRDARVRLSGGLKMSLTAETSRLSDGPFSWREGRRG